MDPTHQALMEKQIQLQQITITILDKLYQGMMEEPIRPEDDEEEGDDPYNRQGPDNEEDLEEERISSSNFNEINMVSDEA